MVSRATKTNKDSHACDLLARHNCPVPYHEVRTRFLGNIASPDLSASPLATVHSLWGGQFPACESVDAANEIVGVLINGLWNSLTQHMNRSEPFHLISMPIDATVFSVAAYALTRQQELDGFIQGLFNGADNLLLPTRALCAVDILAEARLKLAGIQTLVNEPAMRARQHDLIATAEHLRQMTPFLEHEIHTAVIECSQARHMMLRSRRPPRRRFN